MLRMTKNKIRPPVGQLVLIRHGQSDWNQKNLFTGWTDVDLTAQGREEARLAGRTLTDAGSSERPTLPPPEILIEPPKRS